MERYFFPKTDEASEPVAIVGLSLKSPGDCDSVESFWQMLCTGGSTMTEFPPDRFNIDAFYHAEGGTASTVSHLRNLCVLLVHAL